MDHKIIFKKKSRNAVLYFSKLFMSNQQQKHKIKTPGRIKMSKQGKTKPWFQSKMLL